jgi:hypothetical protein
LDANQQPFTAQAGLVACFRWRRLVGSRSHSGIRHAITAADVPITFELPAVQQLAAAKNIELLSYQDLAVSGSLAKLESDSVNVVLMAEIIEHITFNPVEMWKEIYRVVAPGG